MDSVELFRRNLQRAMDDVFSAERENIESAAAAAAKALCSGKTIYTFGTGHAHILAEEIFYRAGGLVKVYPIFDERLMLHKSASESTEWERREGLARELLKNSGVSAGDAVFIFSNSGRNCSPVEAALYAAEVGAKAIAVTNISHSKASSPRNPYGKRLFEVCPIVIDNHGRIGDASTDVCGKTLGPTSTAVGAAIMQAIVCRIFELTCADGKPAETFVSSNIDGGDAINEAFIKKYSGIIPPL